MADQSRDNDVHEESSLMKRARLDAKQKYLNKREADIASLRPKQFQKRDEIMRFVEMTEEEKEADEREAF